MVTYLRINLQEETRKLEVMDGGALAHLLFDERGLMQPKEKKMNSNRRTAIIIGVII